MIENHEKTPCRRCRGRKVVTVSRELSHDEETCPRCKGTGEEPERLAQVTAAIEDFESRRTVDANLRMVQVNEGRNLRVSVNASDLAQFYSFVVLPLGGYNPTLDGAHDYGHGEVRAELLFEPE